MRWTTAVLVISVGLCGAAVAAAAAKDKVYKWVDESGTVHYSAKPEEQVKVEEVAIRKGPEAPDPLAATVQNADEVARCAQIRESVRNLRSDSANLEIQDADGSTRPMTAEERAPLLEKYTAAMAECDKTTPAPAPK